MYFNPFEQKPIDINTSFENWVEIYPKSYNKYDVDPYTKTRIILMNGTEFEANWFSHQFDRACNNYDVRKEIALTRRIEQQQQKKIATLKPKNENILEHTISYEQLAVDLTCELAKRAKDNNLKNALDFALLEDFDHLYRYANLLYLENNEMAEFLVGHYDELMPGRPTIAHHRYPMDNIKAYIDSKTADKLSVIDAFIITAAEQQTMNYYMNVVNLYPTDLGRKLYQEIGLVEEEHVTQYECLQDPNATWFEKLLWHEYVECYLYYSCYCDESNKYVKEIWEKFLEQEIAHLHKAVELLNKYENKDWFEVIKTGEFPQLLQLHENINYVREILKNTVQYTSIPCGYEKVENLSSNSSFYMIQNMLNNPTNIVPSHNVIENIINRYCSDYRFETMPNPIPELRNRQIDNTFVGRYPLDKQN